jgi:hypothetical protein
MKLDQYIQLYSKLGDNVFTASLDISSSAQISSSFINYDYQYDVPVSLSLSGSLIEVANRYNTVSSSLAPNILNLTLASSSFTGSVETFANIGSLISGSNLTTLHTLLRTNEIQNITNVTQSIIVNSPIAITGSSGGSGVLSVGGRGTGNEGDRVFTIRGHEGADRVYYDSQARLQLGNTEAVVSLHANSVQITGSMVASGNISASGDIVGDDLQLGTGRITRLGGTGPIDFSSTPLTGVTALTASGDISASGEIIGNTLTISSNQINFTNLPTSDPGVAGRLYRDGGTVKVSI